MRLKGKPYLKNEEIADGTISYNGNELRRL